MTSKLTITDGRVISVIERLEHYASNLKWTDVRGAQYLLTAADGLRELQERRKADSEPVAEVYQTPNVGICAALGPSIRMLCALEPGTKLYRHAQPAPVVPELRVDWQENEFSADWNACRAAMLHAANSSANPDCWCRTCRPVVLNDMRFVVCPDCGNKRCPRANDHRNACTGSNEPGQEGSTYPDTPREVK